MVRLVGVLNATPDSFHAGSRAAGVADAISRGVTLWQEGAAWVDVGGESTRPGAVAVPVDEELRRVLPVVEGLSAAGVPVSIDTRRPEVAREALRAGARVLNDISGLRDPRMLELVGEAPDGVVVMHMRAQPDTMQQHTHYEDLFGEVCASLGAGLAAARGAGAAQVWLDPGLGFAKTAQQNLELLRRLPELRALGAPLYIGASRKSFIGALLGQPDPADRLHGSVGAALAAVAGGAEALRVHDVAATWQALAVYCAATGREGPHPGGRR